MLHVPVNIVSNRILKIPVTTHVAMTRETPMTARALDPNCPPDPVCDPLAKFRTFDGTCNNLKTSKWGSAGTPLQRVLPNAYADGGE